MAKGKGKATLRPGQTVERSGIYQNDTTGDRTTLEKDGIAPPTQGPKQSWKLKVETNPK
jgi:hypothetical protein